MKKWLTPSFAGVFAAATAAVYIMPVPTYYHEIPEAFALFFMGATIAQRSRSRFLISFSWIASMVAVSMAYFSSMAAFPDPILVWRNMIYAVGLSSFYLLGYLAQSR